MNSLSEVDLGAIVLSIALAAGFVAFGILIFRLIIGAITSIFRKLKVVKSPQVKEAIVDDKGFQENQE